MYIYTLEYYSVVRKEENNAICSTMDEPRECHTEWSKSDREGEILYDSPYMWNLNSNDSNEHTYKTETGSQTSRTSLWLPMGRMGGRES